MSNLIEIKKRIASISSTIKVTKVMHMIASSKVAKIKQKMVAVDKYSANADEVLRLFLKNTSYKTDAEKFLVSPSKASGLKKKMFVLFSSDKGTCGAINTNIFKEMTNIIKQEKKNGSDITILPVGKKAFQFLQTNKEKLGINMIEIKEAIQAEQRDQTSICEIVENIVDAYDGGKFDCINFVYHKYKNIITCLPTSEQILPFDTENIKQETNNQDGNNDFINIDETDGTTKNIIKFFVMTKFYSAYVSNIASIFSSRMNAMDNATKNGKEIIDDLLIKYNKSRQAHITSELSDIVSGFEAIS